jgi:hypothetical protein
MTFDLGEHRKCASCKEQVCECPEREEDGSWDNEKKLYSLQCVSYRPFEVLKTIKVKGYRKAIRLGEQWLEQWPDNYSLEIGGYTGPSYSYTVSELPDGRVSFGGMSDGSSSLSIQ